jgi:hypothetical protein
VRTEWVRPLVSSGVGHGDDELGSLHRHKPFAWVEDFTPAQIRGLGALEVAGAIGLILPMALGVLPVLGPIAALGIAALQAGAFVVHVRRGEKPYLNLVIFALAGATAVLGFFALAAG